MTIDYSSLQTTCVDLIGQFGRDVTLKYVTEGSYNPSTGTITGDSVSEATVKAVFTNYNDNQIDGSIVKRGDRLVLCAGDITPPSTNDIIGGFKIVAIEEVKPADTVLLYKLQVRK